MKILKKKIIIFSFFHLYLKTQHKTALPVINILILNTIMIFLCKRYQLQEQQ